MEELNELDLVWPRPWRVDVLDIGVAIKDADDQVVMAIGNGKVVPPNQSGQHGTEAQVMLAKLIANSVGHANGTASSAAKSTLECVGSVCGFSVWSFEAKRGQCSSLSAGWKQCEPNGTATLVLEANGGAKETFR